MKELLGMDCIQVAQFFNLFNIYKLSLGFVCLGQYIPILPGYAECW